MRRYLPLSRAGADAARAAFVEARGYRVIGFWNNDVLENLEGAIERVQVALEHGR